jgi:transcriptional regulator with XRE-family HTH domain
MAEMTFGERVCYLRESKGWIQRDLAFRMSVKSNTISNWEKGISRPNLDQLVQLCQVLSVTSDSLLGLDKQVWSAR